MVDPASMLVALLAFDRSGKRRGGGSPQWPVWNKKRQLMDDSQPEIPKRSPGVPRPFSGAKVQPLPNGEWFPCAPPSSGAVQRAGELLASMPRGAMVGPEPDPSEPGRSVCYRSEPSGGGKRWHVTVYCLKGEPTRAPPDTGPAPGERIYDYGNKRQGE
jgi:hypothetical protein